MLKNYSLNLFSLYEAAIAVFGVFHSFGEGVACTVKTAYHFYFTALVHYFLVAL